MEKAKLLHNKIKDLNLQFMIKSQKYINLLTKGLSRFENITTLCLAGNQLSISGAKQLSQAVRSTRLEFLNISGCLSESFAAARILLEAISFNTTIRYLNMSNNRFNHLEYEFGSRIGRLIQVHRQLSHIDISACKLHKAELIFIVLCTRESKSLSVIHMGHNNIDYYGRLMLRHLLNAKVKYPFRAGVKLGQHIKTADDKYMVVILNAYLLSSLPPLETQHLMRQVNQRLPTVKSETNNLFAPSTPEMS